MELEFAPPMRNPARQEGKQHHHHHHQHQEHQQKYHRSHHHQKQHLQQETPPTQSAQSAPAAPSPGSAALQGPGQPPQTSSAVQQPSAPSATQSASLPGSAAAPPVPRRPVIRTVTEKDREENEARGNGIDLPGPRSGLGDGPPPYPPRTHQGGGRGAAEQPARPGRKAQTLKLRAAQHISASTQAAADGTLSTGTTLTVVEKQWRPPSWLGLMSHWGRRNAKDELMASFVVSGYYTAITMALFTDLGYYKANFEMAEPMSWGSGAGCALLTDKCVTDGATLYPDMFCTDSSDATLRCTSDRQSLGTCAIYQDDNIPPEFQYFATKQGSRRGAMMEYCPFIAPMNGTGCMDGDEAIMPGSVVGPSSRCLTGENLRMGSTVVGDVCVQLRCGEGTLSVRYRGSEEWHPCAPGQTLTPPAPFTAGSIRCPLFSDVCLTMLKHSDASSTDVESHPKHLAMVRNNDGSALAVTSAASPPPHCDRHGDCRTLTRTCCRHRTSPAPWASLGVLLL
ncbi:putative surface protease GP63 [Trypanosoma cruzi]|uniref:Leishmanolysin-like peptidase n=1 Tax=Trypanosoma cruzi TaxID=5693 RepID=A0A2V2VYS3_TRYCR|nr:putative surface protease GP63 [Trypanosoma cruzi]